MKKKRTLFFVTLFVITFLISLQFVFSQGMVRDESSTIVYFGNLTNLSEMQDVNIPSPTDEQFLQFLKLDNKWHSYTFNLADWWDYDYNDLINSPTTLSYFTNDLGIGNWTADKPNYHTSSQIDNFNLSHWTDDLGNRGYTSLSNFTNDLGYYNSTTLQNVSQLANDNSYWNDTFATFNKTYADTLYYSILNPYSFYNSTTLQNLTQLNNDLGIGNWSYDKQFYYTKTEVDTNISEANDSMRDYVDATFVYRSGGDNLTGQYDYNGGWTDNGLSIIDGDLYAQNVYAVNFSGLTVNDVSTNGSLLPTMDNQFDLGSSTKRWRNLYLGEKLLLGTTSTAVNTKAWIYGTGTSNVLRIDGTTTGRLIDAYINGDQRFYFNNDGNLYFSSGVGAGVYNSGAGGLSLSGRSSTSDMFLKDGYTGIGTTSPDSKLTIVDNNYPEIHLPGSATDGAGTYIMNINEGLNGNEGAITFGVKPYFSLGYVNNWTAKSNAAGIFRSDNGNFYFYGDSGLTDDTDYTPTLRMVITNNGMVGINMYSQEVPDYFFQVKGSNSTTRAEVDISPSTGTANNRKMLIQSDRIQTYVTNSGGVADMFINPYGGKVGIGTTSPTDKLHVDGNLKVTTGGIGVGATIKGSGTINLPADQNAYYIGGTGILSRSNTYNYTKLGAATDEAIRFYVNSSTFAGAFDSNGHLGIGEVNPYYTFEVVGDTSATHDGLQVRSNSYGEGDELEIGFRMTTSEGNSWAGMKAIRTNLPYAGNTELRFFTYGTGGISDKMVISTNGNVGIGTMSPSEYLDIGADSVGSPGTLIFSGTSTSQKYIKSVNAITIVSDSDGNSGSTADFISFQVNNDTEAMRIDTSGNVGIGTTSPTETLEVNGNLKVNGNINVTGCIQYNGGTLGTCV